jgi:hypothetical protein
MDKLIGMMVTPIHLDDGEIPIGDRVYQIIDLEKINNTVYCGDIRLLVLHLKSGSFYNTRLSEVTLVNDGQSIA